MKIYSDLSGLELERLRKYWRLAGILGFATLALWLTGLLGSALLPGNVEGLFWVAAGICGSLTGVIHLFNVAGVATEDGLHYENRMLVKWWRRGSPRGGRPGLWRFNGAVFVIWGVVVAIAGLAVFLHGFPPSD